MSLPAPPSRNSEKITIKKSTYSTLIVGAVIAIAVAAFFAGFFAGSSSTEMVSTDVSKSELENKISALEKKINEMKVPTEQPSQQNPTPSNLVPSPPSTKLDNISLDDDPVKGDPNAPITIVEFSDFQCPFCGRWYTNTLGPITENYIDSGKVKLVYRDMPLNSIHPNANSAHVAAECADEQNKFWDYHDILFDRQAEWNRLSVGDLSDKLNEYATTLGLDSSSFDSCLSSDKMANEVAQDGADARKYGASGTPTFFVGNEELGYTKLVGAQPYQSFQNLIDGQLKKLEPDS